MCWLCLSQAANSHKHYLESEVRTRSAAMDSFDQMNSSLISSNIDLQVWSMWSLPTDKGLFCPEKLMTFFSQLLNVNVFLEIIAGKLSKSCGEQRWYDNSAQLVGEDRGETQGNGKTTSSSTGWKLLSQKSGGFIIIQHYYYHSNPSCYRHPNTMVLWTKFVPPFSYNVF